ncbi:MAG TPA: hypothetical protein VF510_03065 [Ktedonobacterales bacterium]
METSETVTREQVEEQLRHISDDQLASVSHFLAALTQSTLDDDGNHDFLRFAELSLGEEWDTQEEDAAWVHLADLPTW